VLDLGREPPSYRGSLETGPGKLGKLALTRLTAEVHAAAPVLDLEKATVETLGGTVSGTAHLVSAGEGAGLTARLDARGLDLAALPVREDRPRPAGKLTLDASLNAPPPGASGFDTAAQGTGRFGVADGRLLGVALGAGILDVLEPFLKPGEADRFRQRYPDLFGDELRFTKLSGSGRLAGGRVRSEDFVLAGASYEAAGAGSLGLDGTVDVLLRLAASPALTEDLLGDSRARPALVDDRGQLVVPLRVRGPLARPRVLPDPSFAGTAARGLLGGADLKELADDVLDLLGGKRKKGRER
jgi:hypothetical protein